MWIRTNEKALVDFSKVRSFVRRGTKIVGTFDNGIEEYLFGFETEEEAKAQIDKLAEKFGAEAIDNVSGAEKI